MTIKTERQKLQDFLDSQEGICWRNASETLKAIEVRYPNLPVPAATSAQDSIWYEAEYKTIRGPNEALLCWSYPEVYFELAFDDTRLEWYGQLNGGSNASQGGRVNQFDIKNLWWMADYLASWLQALRPRHAARQLDT